MGLLLSLSAQVPVMRKSIEQYIDDFKYDAIREMRESGVPASITLAQGILESDAGNSKLARNANNHFGIKCHKEWIGAVYIQDDDTKDECFRKYESVFDSYIDHSNFLKSRSRYAFLFTLDPTDYESWAYGLKAAGYATDPKYAERLVGIIERYNLKQYDTAKSKEEELSAKADEEHKYNKKIQQIANAKYTNPVSAEARNIQLINERKCVLAHLGETVDDLAKMYDIDPRLIKRYNDLDKNFNRRFKHGDIVYLQPKRKKAKEEYYYVTQGETMHSISQKFGIKLKELYKKNLLAEGQEPKAGDLLWLKKAKKKA